MPVYNSLISRTDAGPLLPDDVVRTLLQGVSQTSVAIQAFTEVPVAAGVARLPVLSALPLAYWVSGDTGVKQTTEAAWANKSLTMEELAAIIPVPQAVLDDTDFDLWNELMPLMRSAVAVAFDQAVFFGTNAPGSFPTNINGGAAATTGSPSHVIVVPGTMAAPAPVAATGGYAGLVSTAMAAIEADGFMPDAIVAHTKWAGNLRNARDAEGQRLSEVETGNAYGVPIQYAMRGGWPTGASAPELFVLDSSQFVVGIRKDVTFDFSTDGVIQDGAGAIVYNLFQQDMAAMRITFRAGWQVANTITFDQPTDASRYPAAVIRAAAT